MNSVFEEFRKSRMEVIQKGKSRDSARIWPASMSWAPGVSQSNKRTVATFVFL